jgi:hypothetical protein
LHRYFLEPILCYSYREFSYIQIYWPTSALSKMQQNANHKRKFMTCRPYMFRQGTCHPWRWRSGVETCRGDTYHVLPVIICILFISLSAFVGQYTGRRNYWWNLRKYVKLDRKACELSARWHCRFPLLIRDMNIDHKIHVFCIYLGVFILIFNTKIWGVISLLSQNPHGWCFYLIAEQAFLIPCDITPCYVSSSINVSFSRSSLNLRLPRFWFIPGIRW